MIDKFASIQRRRTPTNTFSQPPQTSETLTFYSESPNFGNPEGVPEQTLRNVASVRAMIQRIQANNVAIQTIKRRYQQATKGQQQKQCSLEIQKILNENSGIHKSAKGVIDQMRLDVAASENDPRLRGQPETKMKRNMLMAISQELAETLQYQKAQEDGFKSAVKNKVVRQAKLTDPTLTEPQLEFYANNPNQAAQLLTKRMGVASFHLRNAVADIQEKCRDIERLQRTVAQCLYLFKELSEMVFAQGQLIDNIQYHVRDAQDYIQRADVQIVKAKQKRDCKRKCCCWTTIIVVIVVVVVVAVIVPIAIKVIK